MTLDSLQRSEQAALKNLDFGQIKALWITNFSSSVSTRMDMVEYQTELGWVLVLLVGLLKV
jgi:hypothetical protein